MTTVFRSPRWERIAPLLLAVAAVTAYSAISIFRHQHYGSSAFDLGNQDQAVWGYSRLRIIPDTLLGLPTILGDHFNPILMTLAPLYWLWGDARVLLVAQAVIVAAASLPVQAWARARLGRPAALAIQASFLVFWGVLAGIVYDFHHVVFAVLAVSVAIYAIRTRRDRLLWVMVAVALLTREDVALVIAGLGVYLAATQRRWRSGASLVAVAVAWFLLIVRVVVPFISGNFYGHWEYGALGPGPVQAAGYVLTHPLDAGHLFFFPLEKTRTLLATLGPWLLTSLLSPVSVLLVPVLAPRFWASDPNLWSAHYQYSLMTAPVLAFAAIDVLDWLRRHRSSRAWMVPALATAILAANLVATFVLVRPLSELGSYISDAQAARIDDCLKVIPRDASVAASNALVPHLSDRKEIYLLPAGPGTDFVALDLDTEAQSPGNVLGALRARVSRDLRGGYGVACSRGPTLVLRRDAPAGRLSPELARFLRSG